MAVAPSAFPHPLHRYQRFLAQHGGAVLRDLTRKQLRHGIFHDVQDLVRAIDDYITRHNSYPKPFIWTAKASDILEKVKRAGTKLDNGQPARRTTLDPEKIFSSLKQRHIHAILRFGFGHTM